MVLPPQNGDAPLTKIQYPTLMVSNCLDPTNLGTPPNQGPADLSIPEGALASNSTVLNTSDPSSWNMSSSYPDSYGTSVLGDSNRKRPSPK